MKTKFTVFIFSLFATFFLHGNTPEEMNSRWKQVLDECSEYPEGLFEGKGIVIPAGGEYYLINAWVNLSILRYKGCKLPVEVWYIGEDEYIPDLIEKLEALGAKCCDITHYFDYPIKGFEVKPHAILASRFREVMLIDADNVALRNPTFLFDSPEYLSTGALFWPDQMMIQKENILWSVLELPPRLFRGQESGQLVVDKKQCWKALNLCLHMNKESHFYYKHIHGDKDTFFLSFMVTKSPYHMITHLPGLVFRERRAISFVGFLQRDFNGEPLFCHATDINWSDRTNLQPMWHFYNLTDKKINVLKLTFPWTDSPWLPFREKFGMIEDRGLRILKSAKPSLPNS